MSFTDEELNDRLTKFIHEVNRKDGKRYMPETLVSIIAGIQQSLPRNDINFFRDRKFKPIIESLDSVMKITRKKEGQQRKSASIISLTNEDLIWQRCIGEETPEKLLKALFYLNGIHFALRGGEEHR